MVAWVRDKSPHLTCGTRDSFWQVVAGFCSDLFGPEHSDPAGGAQDSVNVRQRTVQADLKDYGGVPRRSEPFSVMNAGLHPSAFVKKGIITMSNISEASSLHKKAASEHEAAAKHHHKAAECHDRNKLDDAKSSSKSAMDCCNTAQKQSKSACDCSAK